MTSRPRWVRLCCTAAVLIVHWTLATAQDLSPTLKPGDRVRVHTEHASVLEGRLLAASRDTLVVVSGAEGVQERRAFDVALKELRGSQRGSSYLTQYYAWAEVDTVPREDIAALWRRGNAAGTGALVGALFIGVGSVAFMRWGFCYEGGCPVTEFDFLVFFGGASAGALLGAAVGLAVPKWHRVESSMEVGVSWAPNGKLGLGARIAL